MLNKIASIRFLKCYFTLVMILFISFGSIHCGRGDEQTNSDPSTITILYPGYETFLSHCTDVDLRLLVFLPLISYNQDGEMEGRLAESWEHSSDYRSWTIHLRKDMRWHDGVPVTAHDIKFTLDLMCHPDVAWIKPEDYSISVLDDYSYMIKHNSGPDYSSLDDWRVYYPKHLLEDLDPEKLCSWDFWKRPVGNGPYRFVRLVPMTLLEFEANPDYYLGKPKIERVIIKFGYSVIPELLSGNVDAAVRVNQFDLLKLKKYPQFRKYSHLTNFCGGIYWNQKHEKFSDPRVRRALTMAINRRELHQVLNLPDNLPIFDVIHTARQFTRGELPEPVPYDPEQARRLLDEAGWRDVDKNGIRERGGEEFRFTAITSGDFQTEAIYIQEQFRKVGVHMEIKILEYMLALNTRRSGNFEAAIHWVRRNRVASTFIGKDSPIGYYNQRIEQVLAAARSTFNPEVKDNLYREIWPVFQDDLPVTFLYPSRFGTNVAHRRIRGLSSPHRTSPILNMEHLWIEDEK